MLLFYQGCPLFRSLHFKNMLKEVQKKLCANSKSKKSDPKHPSGLPSITSGHLSVSNIHPDDMAIASGHPSVSRSFKLFKVASVQTSQQHVRMLFSVRQEIKFPSQTQIWEDNCIRSNVWSTPSRHYP